MRGFVLGLVCLGRVFRCLGLFCLVEGLSWGPVSLSSGGFVVGLICHGVGFSLPLFLTMTCFPVNAFHSLPRLTICMKIMTFSLPFL